MSENYFDFKYDEHPEKNTTVCICGGDKRKSSPLCYYCFIKLPHEMSEKLHKQFGLGYEEGYAESVEYLKNEYGIGELSLNALRGKNEFI